jgi:hypothetical protein
MDTPKWYSRLIHMAVILAVLLSLMGLAVLPVAAQPDATLGVTVDTDADEYCVCHDIYVTANVTNFGPDACNVSANLTWSPWSGASWVSSPSPNDLGEMAVNSSQIVEWTLHCDEPGALNITVNATGTLFVIGAPALGATNDTDSKVVMQWGRAELKTLIFTPQEGDTFHVCETFPLLFQITNNGTAPALHVNGTIFPSDNVNAITKGGVSLPCGAAYTTGTLTRLDPGESYNWTVMMHCCGCDEPPLVSSIHVVPNGDGFCSGQEIQDKYTYSDIVRINQTYNVTCDAEPNPTKVCHNVTFTAWFGECAEYPMSWNWTFGDGNWEAGIDHDPAYPVIVTHHYNVSDNYTAVIDVTDGLGVNGTCNVTVEVFPPLSARCLVEPYDFTKLCHNLTFNGTAVGGFPADMCNYTWTWDFGDNTTVNGTGYSSGPQVHSYCNATGNYTAVFTIEDDCMNNTANCSMNITVFPPLGVWCTVSSNVTKVCHNVTFDGGAIDGIPSGYMNCTYNWTWDFGDGTSQSGTGPNSCPGVSHHYNATGNYTAVFTIQDNCWNNTATCNETVEVFPRLEVVCEGQNSTVCNAVNFTAVRFGGIPTANYTWEWDFGDPFDPTPAFTQNATHIYMCTGNYTATVTVCDDLEPMNCANCSVNVTITIEPPELLWPGNGTTVTTGCNNTVCFEWEDIGCCNYTLQIWQKDTDVKVWNINTGKDNFACVSLWDNPIGWRWQVVAVDMCGEWVVSDVWYFNTVRDCMYPDVTVTRPNGGETFECGTNETITWKVTEYGTVGDGLGIDQSNLYIDIYYSINGGLDWTPVVIGWWNSGAYPWPVPDVNSNQCVVVVVASDAQGNWGNDVSDGVFTIECAPPPSTCTTLYAGWNLYATPLIPDNTDITNVTAAINDTVSIIYAYNASSGGWLWYVPGNSLSTLTTMEDGVGYWIFMNSTDTLCIVGREWPADPLTPQHTYPVVPGWNLIGFKSTIPLDHSLYLGNLWSGGLPNYSVLYSYDGSVPIYVRIYPYGTDIMEPGHGFWLWATAAGLIVPI